MQSARPSLPPGKPKVLVIGAGAVATGAIEEAARQGFDTTVVARSAQPKAGLKDLLLEPAGVKYVSADVFSPQGQGDLYQLLLEADLVIMAAEPYPMDAQQEREAEASLRRFYDTARSANFTREVNDYRREKGMWPKRIVRVGSPPAEIPRERMGDRGPFQEDGFTSADLQRQVRSDPLWQNSYFRTKVAAASVVEGMVQQGLDVVTVAPTAVVSWYADHGRELEAAAQTQAKSPPVMPAIPTDAVPSDVAGRGMLLAGIFGQAGETYQLAGAKTDSHRMLAPVLEAVGAKMPPAMPMSLEKAAENAKLLAVPQDYGRQVARNMADLFVNPFRATANIARGYQDFFADSSMKAMGMKPELVALGSQMGHRSSEKVRGLNEAAKADARFASLAYPSDAEITAQMPQAYRRQAAWLQRAGLLQGRPVNVDLTFKK